MAKLRVVQIEIEDATGGFGDVLAAVLGGGGRQMETHRVPGSTGASAVENGPPLKRGRLNNALPAPAARHKKLPAKTAGSISSESIPGRILAALKKKPMSSLEIGQALGLEPQQVYAPCSGLKSKGLIESRVDEQGDGTRRYFAK